MKIINDEHKEANLSLFIDDASMQASDASLVGVVDKLMPAMILFKKYTDKLKLKLSSKGCIVASHTKLALILQKECLQHGVAFSNQQEC